VKCERVRTRRILENRCRDVLSVDRNGQARHIRRSATHLRLQLIDGVDKNIVVLLQPLELPSTISKYVGYGPGPTAAAAARADPPRPPAPPARAPGLPTRARAPTFTAHGCVKNAAAASRPAPTAGTRRHTRRSRGRSSRRRPRRGPHHPARRRRACRWRG
jgi:hypothetical protein